MEPAKELFLYQDSKVVAKTMRQAKIQPLRECDLVSKVVLWDNLADVIKITEEATKEI